jgi:GT2 family glycosyltransferase
VRPFFKELLGHGALVRRIEAARLEKPVQFGGENFVSRSKARVCALVRGWGNVEMTTRALSGLRANHPPEDLRIIYVDNGSDVNDFNGLTSRFEDVEFVRFPENQGSCRGINAGMVLAAMEPHEFVIIMDNDAAPPPQDPNWLERWMACFKDPSVGCAGAVTDYVSGGQHIEDCPETYMREFSREDGAQGSRGIPRIPVVVSFAVMFRRSALEAIGWLADERFEPGNSEDTDLSLRVREAGWEVVVAQSVWIHHEGSQTFNKTDFEGLLEGNTEKLVEKYGIERLGLLDIKVTR